MEAQSEASFVRIFCEREFTANSLRAMVAAGVGVMVSIGPLVVSTFGILQSAFGKEYGWSRTSFSLVILLCAVTGGLVTPFAGRAVDRLGVRRVMLPGVALFGLAILGVTLVHGQLWQLYLCYVLVGLTAGVQNMVAYNKLASVWFQRHRGLVLSFLSTCYGIAAAIIPQIVRPLIDHHGWQAGYWFLGAVVLLSLLILVPWLRLPRDRIVTSPVTSDPVKQGRDAQTASGISAKEARNKFIFWLLLLVVVLAVGSLIGTVAQLFPMLTDRGVSRQNATTVLSFTAIGGILGQLSYGYLMDRVRTPKMAVPFFLCALVGATILHREAVMSALVPGAVLMGIGQGAELGLAAYLTSRYFGTRHMGEIYGLVYAGATIAAGVGPVLMARAYDYSGSYRPMLLASELALVAVVMIIMTLPRYVYPVSGQAASSTAATSGES